MKIDYKKATKGLCIITLINLIIITALTTALILTLNAEQTESEKPEQTQAVILPKNVDVIELEPVPEEELR